MCSHVLKVFGKVFVVVVSTEDQNQGGHNRRAAYGKGPWVSNLNWRGGLAPPPGGVRFGSLPLSCPVSKGGCNGESAVGPATSAIASSRRYKRPPLRSLACGAFYKRVESCGDQRRDPSLIEGGWGDLALRM